jgi:hypothetical protein
MRHDKKRGEATKKILERLKKGPAFPKQISNELDLPISTVNYKVLRFFRWITSSYHETGSNAEIRKSAVVKPLCAVRTA